MEFFSRLARTTEAPARTLQYRLRRLAVVTARGVHDIMHSGVRMSLRGGGVGPRPGQAPPGAAWEADDETDGIGEGARAGEQLRRAEGALWEGLTGGRGDEEGRGGSLDLAPGAGDGETGMEETTRGQPMDVLA